MTYTTNVTTGTYDTIEEAAEAIKNEGRGQAGTIYDEDGEPVARLEQDGLIVY